MLMYPWVASCNETAAHISEYVDGELTPWRERRVLRHLARCERCEAMLASLRRALDQLRELGQPDVVEPKPALADAVVERIRRGDY